MTPALQPSAFHTTNHLVLITRIFSPFCPSPISALLYSCPTVHPSLFQGPANFILIGQSLVWDRSASLSTSISPSLFSHSILPPPPPPLLCVFLYVPTPSSLFQHQAAAAAVVPFFLGLLTDVCPPSPVDLTFHKTKQIALMLSGNKLPRFTYKGVEGKCEAIQLGKSDG